jgi:serine/threonine protein kinase
VKGSYFCIVMKLYGGSLSQRISRAPGAWAAAAAARAVAQLGPCSRPCAQLLDPASLVSHPPAARAGKRLPMTQAVKWGADVAKGLVELHRLGVVCADLKPDNVLIDDDLGDAVIADFGISSVVAGTLEGGGGVGGARRGPAGARSSGNIRGTPNYM